MHTYDFAPLFDHRFRSVRPRRNGTFPKCSASVNRGRDLLTRKIRPGLLPTHSLCGARYAANEKNWNSNEAVGLDESRASLFHSNAETLLRQRFLSLVSLKSVKVKGQ
jgi:hypothetical protein